MPTTYGILYDKDRRVKVLNNGTPVVASLLQSQYAKYINFIGSRFTTVANGDKYDISLTYPDKIIPYEGGVAQGTIPGYLDFNDTHFDVSALTGDKYVVTNPGYGKVFVNAYTAPRKLNITNATNHEAFTIAEDIPNDEVDLVFRNDEVDIFNNGTLITAQPRRINLIGFTTADDVANNRVNITGNFLPDPFNKKYGMMYGSQNTENPSGVMAGDGLLNIPYATVGGGNKIYGGFDPTHGVYRRYTLGSDDDDRFIIASGADITNRSANPRLYGKMRINTLQDFRFFLGFHTGTVPDNNNDFLNNLHGFGLTAQLDSGAPDTQWQIRRNNGTAATTKVSTGISIAAGTVFTFELLANNSVPNWQWNVNGGAYTAYTTSVPTTQDLRFTFQLEEIGTNEAIIDVFYLYWIQDH